jgi:hypothetical protein
MFGTASFPAWSITQPARDESKSAVKNIGKGVEVGSGVNVIVGVKVTGIGVEEGVAVGKRGATGVGVVCWHAVSKSRSAMRSFFMAPIKTQLSGALYRPVCYLQVKQVK